MDITRSASWPPTNEADDAGDSRRGEDPADLRAGEPEHVAEIERQQRQPRSPDEVFEEHHHREARRCGRHDVAVGL